MNKILLGLLVIFSVLISFSPVLADSNVHITPDPARANDVLTCYVTYNPNNPAQYMYKWLINGAHASGLDNYFQVPSNYPKIRGETFTCEVSEDLGYYGGIVLIGSHSVSIINSAPVMDTLTLVSGTGSSGCVIGGRLITISYSAHDDDGDPLTYTIDWGDGSANTVTTATTSSHLYTSTGTFTITVTASDGQSTSAPMMLVVNIAPCPPPGQTTANITLQSAQNNGMTINLPTIVFNGTSYTVLPTTLINIPTQVYTINYLPQPGFAFLNWTTTGALAVASPTSASTTVNMTGNGVLTAIYQDVQAPNVIFVPPTPANGAVVNVNCTTNTATVTFSVDITDNAGNGTSNIVSVNLNLNGTIYAMTYASGITWTATVTGLAVGSYSYNATATDASGNSFTTPTRTFAVSNSSCGGGTTGYSLVLNSREIISSTPTNLGSTTFNSTVYTLPNTLTNVPGNTYTISYAPVSGFGFDHWEANITSGSITFGNSLLASTTATIAGNGTITAVYKNLSVNYTINLQSEHLTNTTILNLGNIVFATTPYSLPNSLSRTAGTYSIDFNAPSNYTFDHWNVTGGISLTGSTTAKANSVVVTGNGTIKAVFKDSVNNPPIVNNVEPASGTRFKVLCSNNKANVKINAIVTDDTGVQSVKAQVNGTNYTMSGSGSAYSVMLSLAAGTYSFKIIARDASGQETTTGTRSFTVTDETCEGGEDSLLVYAQIADDEKAKPGEETYILVKLYNSGSSDIEEIRVKVTIPDFPFTRTIGPFDVKPGWNSKIIYFDVPEDAAPGEYDVQVNVFNEEIKRFKYRMLTVVGTSQASVEEQESPAIEPMIPNEVSVKTSSNLPVILALLFAIVLVLVALTFAVKLLYESREDLKR